MEKVVLAKRIEIIHYFCHLCARNENSSLPKTSHFFIQRAIHRNLKKYKKDVVWDYHFESLVI